MCPCCMAIQTHKCKRHVNNKKNTNSSPVGHLLWKNVLLIDFSATIRTESRCAELQWMANQNCLFSFLHFLAQSNALISIFPFVFLPGISNGNDFIQYSVHWAVSVLYILIYFAYSVHICFDFLWCLCVRRLEPCDSAAALSSLEASGPEWSWTNQRGRTMAQ